jgi:hypothetical protein
MKANGIVARSAVPGICACAVAATSAKKQQVAMTLKTFLFIISPFGG